MIITLLGVACANAPPVVMAVNGQKTVETFGTRSLPEPIPFSPGKDVDLSLDVNDPEGGAVVVWWPRSPPGFDFPSDGVTGVWHVPDDYANAAYLTLVVQDSADPPEGASLDIAFGDGSGDTGVMIRAGAE